MSIELIIQYYFVILLFYQILSHFALVVIANIILEINNSATIYKQFTIVMNLEILKAMTAKKGGK